MPKVTLAPNSGVELPRVVRDRLANLVHAHGESYVMALTGLTRATLARAMAGLGVRRGTIAQIEQGLSQLGGSQ